MDTAKKLLSVLLSVLLMFPYSPALAWGETAGQDPAVVASGEDGSDQGSADVVETLETADLPLVAQNEGPYEWTDASAPVKYTYTIDNSEGERATIVSVAVTDAMLAESSLDLVIPSAVGENNVPVVALGTDDHGQDRGFYFFGDGQGWRNAANHAIRSVTVPASVTTVGSGFFESPDRSTVTIKEIVFPENSPVSEIPSSCFAGLSKLESVVLPAGLVQIGDNAFAECPALTTVSYAGAAASDASVTLPTSLTSIGDQAFKKCTALVSAEIPEGTSSLGKNAFAQASALASVTLPNSLRTIGEQAFYECGALASVAFGTDMATAQLVTIGKNAFKGAALTSALIPDSVTTIAEGAFMNQKSGGTYTLTEVKLGSSRETSQLQTIGIDAFRNAAITEIALPNTLESLSYTYTFGHTGYDGSPFAGCSKLRNILWPTAKTERSFTEIGGFWDCSALDNNDVISSIPAWITVIDDYAFTHCSFTSACIPDSIERVGYSAFNGNKLTEVSIPASVQTIEDNAFYCKGYTLSSLSIADGRSSLYIGDNQFYRLADGLSVELPASVSYLGEGVFDSCTNNTFFVYNKDFVSKRYNNGDPAGSADLAGSPWKNHNGYCGTVYYPQDAAADSHIMRLKADWEDHQNNGGNHLIDFVPFDATATKTYTITGTVPEGAEVVLLVDGTAQEVAWDGATFTYAAPRGSMVGAAVTLAGHAGLTLSPEEGRNAATLSADWTFEVTADDLTPLSETGTLQVHAVGDYSENANVAVFDAATGRLVSQGRVLRARVHFAEDLAAGTYDVVAWQGNDYFSSVSSMGDFAALGFDGSDYALEQVTLDAREVKELELTVPELDTTKIAAVLASGSVTIPNGRIVQGVAFHAQVTYEMAAGHTASAIKLNIPQGMTPVTASSAAKSYGVAGWDADAGVLTVGGLAADDQGGATITVGLTVAEAGTFALSATLTSGNVTVPLGSARVETAGGAQEPATELVVPQGTLSSATFPVYVYAAPGTEVSFKIGETALDVTCTTNKAGFAQAELTIPEAEQSAYSHYLVTATFAGDKPTSVTEVVEYSPLFIPYEPTVQQFYFDHAGSRVYLVKDGWEVSSGSYVAYINGPADASVDNWSTWPFTVVIDSLQPLQDTLLLQLGMVDRSVRDDCEMTLQGTEELENGAVRYTYTYDLAVGDGVHSLPRNGIPLRFDLVPQLALDEVTYPTFTQANVDALKRTYAQSYGEWASEVSSVLLSEDNAKVLSYWANDNTGADPNDLGVFNEAFRHEQWDPNGEIWAQLTPAERDKVVGAEDMVADLYDYLAWYMGDSKPLYAYSSLEDYLQNEYGYAMGLVLDPAALEAQGYAIIYDNDPTSVPHAGTPNAAGELVAPAWSATRVVVNDESGMGQLDYADANGNVLSFARPLDRWANGGLVAQEVGSKIEDELDGSDAMGYIGDGITTASNVIDGIGDEIFAMGRGHVLQSNIVKGVGKGLGALGFFFTAFQQKKGLRDWGNINSVIKEREAELERLKMMDAYYEGKRIDKTQPLSPCQKALQTEQVILESYLKDLKKNRWVTRVEWPLTLVLNGFGAYALVSTFTIPGVQEVSAPIAAGAAVGSLVVSGVSSEVREWLAPDRVWNYNRLKQYRAYREKTCRNDEFGKLHYKKYTKFDPSGYTFEGVESERVEGVVATIYQFFGGDWKVWDEAADYEEVNPQPTNAAGLFAWDVPEGSWKILFTKEGYDNVWSQVMDVLPEWTNVAINMLRTDAPAIDAESAEVSPERTYVDLSFDQFMLTDQRGVPAVQVDGQAVEGATWQGAQAGRDYEESAVELARVLRVPLPAQVAPGQQLEVTISGAKSYAGKDMEAQTLTVTVPNPGTPVYRLYNNKTSEHLYTTDKGEYDALPGLTNGDWEQEDVAWLAPAEGAAGATPVWRLYNKGLGDHHYTANKQERDALVARSGWTVEGEAFLTAASDSAGVVGLHRLYNSRLLKGQHHYTAKDNERDALVTKYGWEYEGIAFYGYPA